MALRIRICRVDEVLPGELRGFAVAGLDVPVMVANLDGLFVAASSMCPHEDVSLLGGDRDGARVICPGHAYEFDLITGRCPHDPDLCLPTYRVTIIDEDLWVDLV
jgi:nitrite reductase/ring-hydroxylating ferredoxin subunit